MRFDIMTLFPEAVSPMLNASILGRAQKKGLIEIHAHQIRDYTVNRQNQVDDYPYGGGRGAIMQCDPLYRCWAAICDELGAPAHTIYLSPCGAVFQQEKAMKRGRLMRKLPIFSELSWMSLGSVSGFAQFIAHYHPECSHDARYTQKRPLALQKTRQRKKQCRCRRKSVVYWKKHQSAEEQ